MYPRAVAHDHAHRTSCGRLAPFLALLVTIAAALTVPAATGAKAMPKPAQVSVMTRNLYLGADLTPGVQATSLQGLVDAAGVILAELDRNNFKVRARGLAAEIVSKNPDLVGLQEVALWRTEPCTESPLPPHATQVRYDFLQLLLAQLNKGKTRYRAVIAQPEFDFEVWVNSDGNQSTAAAGCPLGSEFNGRLTMRDVILARTGRVQTSNARGATFGTLLQVKPGGVATNVTRGWTRVDAKVPGAATFRFVNTHLEAFDNQASNHASTGSDVGNGAIREAQAKELVKRGGPATGPRPVILVGDLNSDIRTEVKPGDGLAYRAVVNAGFAERSTSRPLSCCLIPSVLTTAGGGKASDFNHQVDHVMTNAPKKVRLLSASVTGRKPVNGFWDSDHAGLFSALSVP
jgi:endonuclease/exonuclease/phosphatase family metal-dependent hydrolase